MICPNCNIPQEPKEYLNLWGKPYIKLTCSHLVENKLSLVPKEDNKNEITPLPDSILEGLNLSHISSDGKSLLPFQKTGVRFIEDAYKEGKRGVLIADQQGLGKTIQDLYFFMLHKEELVPALFIVKSGLKAQWLYEIFRWLGREYTVQIISSSKDIPLPNIDIYIASFDIFRRFEEEDEREILTASGSRVTQKIQKSPWLNIDFKLVTIDECQHIKNSQSKRTQAIARICKKAKFVIGLSGTPIKNNAGEFFSILHFIAPEEFRDEQSFNLKYVDTYTTARGGTAKSGIKPWMLKPFEDITKDIIIRRTREEVMPELPTITRQFQHCGFDSKKLEKEYNKELGNLIDHLLNKQNSKNFMAEGIAMLSRMRHICGVNKINPTIEYVTDFLESTNRKIVIFTHHIDVMDTIYVGLEAICNAMGINPPLKLHSGLGSFQREDLVQEFKLDENRIMIASTLASGEGLNLQFCSDCIMVERQWNPANEEQAEGRFIRIGMIADKVTAVYMIASKTIDEYFTELVERKRAIIAQALDRKDVNWEESSLMQELFNVVLGKRK